jgi:hypothetical protein
VLRKHGHHLEEVLEADAPVAGFLDLQAIPGEHLANPIPERILLAAPKNAKSITLPDFAPALFIDPSANIFAPFAPSVQPNAMLHFYYAFDSVVPPSLVPTPL